MGVYVMVYSAELSEEFIQRIKMGKKTDYGYERMPQYEIARRASGEDFKISDADMSKLIHKYPGRWSDRKWKERIYRVGKVIGLKPEECFKELVENTNDGKKDKEKSKI